MDLDAKISVVLTAWQRPQLLEEQVERILEQSVRPQEIVLWYNAPPRKLFFFERKQMVEFRNSKYVKKIICDFNFGVIPRFTLAACLEGDYVCIFDDDTMPGERWFENCLHYVDDKKVMCGTIGLRYLSVSGQRVETETPRMGWEGMNEQFEYVDLVGHSWFFRREWAPFFWDAEPICRDFGEDIHFCAMLANHGIKVGCPPHPEGDRSLWGSVKGELGIDKVAISSQDRSKDYARCVQHVLNNGYVPVLQRGESR